jgi:hypothetical protein
MALEKEMQTYRQALPTLLTTSAGKFVLIHGDQIIGAWDTEEEAIEAGDQRFGLEPFLVHRVQETDQPRFIPFDLGPQCRF